MRRRAVRQICALLFFMVAAVGVYFMMDTRNMPIIAKCTDCDNRSRHILSVIERRTRPNEPHDQVRMSAGDATLLFRNQETTISRSTFHVALENHETDVVIPNLWPTATEFARSLETTSKAATEMLPKTPPSEHGADLLGSNNTRCAVPLLGDDDLVRHCITNEVIGRIPEDMRTALFRTPKGNSPETAEDRRHSFGKVFKTRAWGHDWDAQHKGLNASGMGATLHWTQEAIGALHIIINQMKQFYNVTRVRLLDVPCGDLAWMSRFLKTRDDIDYTGVDIVPDLIEHHRQMFKDYPWKFDLQDVVTSATIGTYHLVLCRTLLQHLFFHDAFQLLERISNSGSGFLLTTSFYKTSENAELVFGEENPGRFRRINVEVKPFALVPPRCAFRDGPPDAFEGWNHFLGLWKLPLRKVRRCKAPVPFGLHGTKEKIYSCTDWSLT